MKKMAGEKHTPVGYDDTPVLPGQPWRVHDSKRPQPRVVAPGDGAGAPSDATVLFDGSDTSGWVNKEGGPIGWTVENGYMQVEPKTGNISSKAEFGDCQLHIEFAVPKEVKGSSQGRGNSGIFLMGLYEVQVLDGYDNPTYADGLTGAIYGQFPPLVNACRKPGEWQAYDIMFVAPRYQDDKLVSPAYLTVILNGVMLHHHKAAHGPTGHKNLSSYDPAHGPKGPLMLQDHGDLVRFRKIWMREFGDYDDKA
ncbi:TPA: DUF1080 domain-containing protein [Candidatus Latescibacteria bacterium]|nr:DUF1080 domain-containing protein [Candidatus Latescibacterota bacterium]